MIFREAKKSKYAESSGEEEQSEESEEEEEEEVKPKKGRGRRNDRSSVHIRDVQITSKY